MEVKRAKYGLPRLPQSHAPWSSTWSNSIAICAVMRNENVTDVREWLQYHRWIGVDHCYLTDNDSTRSMQAGLQDFIDSGFLTLGTFDEPQAQLLVYRRCLQLYRGKSNWMAFIDVDEFIGVRQRGASLKGILADYQHFPGLALHWIFVGANDRVARPPQGGVLRDYTKCDPEPNNQVKTIVNTFFVADIGLHPHNMQFRGQAVPVNEAKVPIANRFGIGRDCSRTPEQPGCDLTVGYEVPRLENRSVQRLALYHYVTKSLEDFEIKAKRGGGTNPTGKPRAFFDHMQRLANSSEAICKDLSQVADTCCPRS